MGGGVTPAPPLEGPHSGVRLLLLLMFAATLPELPMAGLWLAGALALVWLYARSAAGARFYLNGLWRLRWLFFAIVVLHLWRGGGTPIWPTLPGLTDLGAEEALRRCGVLVALLGAVVALTRSTPPQWLAAGLLWCLAPLRRLGVPVQRFARRVALVFAAVDAARGEAGRLRGRGEGLETAAARMMLEAESGRFAGDAVWEIPPAGLPRARDYLLLTAACAAVLMVYAV